MNISTAIKYLKKKVLYPSKGLPDDLFYYVSSITPMINVDLLIKNKKGHTLLAWRDDQYAGKGWHIPGGIIRFKESINEGVRIYCDLKKLGAPIEFFDVGGGVGINYDGSRSNCPSSTNYTLKDYVADVVYILKDICDV